MKNWDAGSMPLRAHYTPRTRAAALKARQRRLWAFTHLSINLSAVLPLLAAGSATSLTLPPLMLAYH